jgi:hypothetical protein
VTAADLRAAETYAVVALEADSPLDEPRGSLNSSVAATAAGGVLAARQRRAGPDECETSCARVFDEFLAVFCRGHDEVVAFRMFAR